MSGAVCTTCPYCGVGCGVQVSVADDVVQVQGDEAHPANLGRLCVKGSALGDTVTPGGRLLAPEVDGQVTDWHTALDTVAARLQHTIEHYGPDAVAFYVSGQLLTEDYYVANKLMKGFIGSANIDTNSRLCMSTAVAAHKRVLGSDTVPGCYEDLELADLIVITGSNMAWTHPVVYQRIVAAKQARPEMRVVVIDPRRTATAELADLHLAVTPGSDGYLFDGLLAWLDQVAAVDTAFVAAHTDNFASVIKAARRRSADLATVAAQCGLPESELHTFYHWFAQTPRTVTVFSQGINQSASGVDKATAILNCHLATNRVGRPGATPFSITGQPNAMGGREVGGLANQLAAHMDFDDASLSLVSRFWQTERLARTPGLKAVDLFEAVADGRIRFIWIMATNPAVSLPNADRVRDALAACPTVVVSDCVADTDTLRLADIRLPATGWGEKDGTVTNSERRISRQRGFMPAPGLARPDWWIVTQIGQRLAPGPAFDYSGPADIFREHAALSATENQGRRDFDLGALASLSDQDYDQLAPVQWPVPLDRPDGTPRVFADGNFFTDNRRARFVDACPQPAALHCDRQWPFLMNSGRIRDQWHTMTRTGRSPRLLQHIAEPFVDIHPDDMRQLGLEDGQLVRVSNDLGDCVLRARPQAGQQRGTVFVPIHWSDCFASAARVDALVPALCDPLSGQPAFKQTPVQLHPLKIDWQARFYSRQPLPLPANEYWCRHQVDGWQVHVLAGGVRPRREDLKALWGESVSHWAEFDDSEGEDVHLIGYADQQVICWFSLANEMPLVDEQWLLTAFDDSAQASLGLMLGRPVTGGDSSPLVCSCHQVREARLLAAMADGHGTVEALGRCTRAGTNCGSCIPELKQLLARTVSEETP